MTFPAGGHFGPATPELYDLFAEEIGALAGHVSDSFVDDSLLIARAVLPLAGDVTPGDTIEGGVAIRAAGSQIVVHPYTLRKVCTNGAVMALATSSTRIERIGYDGIVTPAYEISTILARVSEAVHASAAPEAFLQSIDDMRSAMHHEANLALHFLPRLQRTPTRAMRAMFEMIVGSWSAGDDRSEFGLMNAITAVARDTADPELRWTLEEVAGCVCARARDAYVNTRRMSSSSGSNVR